MTSRPLPPDLPPLAPEPLPYASVFSQGLTARHVRLIILLCAALLGLTALLFNPTTLQNESFGWGILGTPVGPIMEGSMNDFTAYLIYATGYLGLFLLSEWLFLLPRGRLSFHVSERHRSRKAAAIGAGFIGVLLTGGLAASVMEWAHVWEDWLGAEVTIRGFVWRGLYGFWIAMAAAWVLWAVIFYAYYRDADHHTAVAKMTRALLAGTVLELLVSIPAYVRSLHEPDNCYCGKGSYTGLVFGCTAVFWLFGPGVYLLWIREQRRWSRRCRAGLIRG